LRIVELLAVKEDALEVRILHEKPLAFDPMGPTGFRHGWWQHGTVIRVTRLSTSGVSCHDLPE
jgi:hypothetical protein